MTNPKTQLRQEMRLVLSRLDSRWLRAANAEVCRNLDVLLGESRFRMCRHILGWTAFFPGEIDLTPFISSRLDSHKIYLPRILPDASMQFVCIGSDWFESLEEGTAGIPEPSDSGEIYDPAHAGETVVLVPGLAFDRRGNRLGRGRGHYDRFLGRPALRAASKIGVCWNLQIAETVPTQAHDVTLDALCHEHGTVIVDNS